MKQKNRNKLTKKQRLLHNQLCSWGNTCSDENIEFDPICRHCNKRTGIDSFTHKGVNTACDTCFGNLLREAIY